MHAVRAHARCKLVNQTLDSNSCFSLQLCVYTSVYMYTLYTLFPVSILYELFFHKSSFVYTHYVIWSPIVQSIRLNDFKNFPSFWLFLWNCNEDCNKEHPFSKNEVSICIRVKIFLRINFSTIISESYY